MMWDLPTAIKIGDKEYKITNECDYRVVLDAICALNEPDYTDAEKIYTALWVFYEAEIPKELTDVAVAEMYKIISCGEETNKTDNSPALMDWKHDFMQIAPPVSRVLGYDVRNPNQYTHWYTFVGGYQEIGECQFRDIVAIRNKKQKGKKLEDWEQEFYRMHRKIVDLPFTVSDDEMAWISED